MSYHTYALYNHLLSDTHLLIAGCTGSGKSVVVNGMIHRMMLNKPTDTQFVLIDLKRVELNQYRKVKHCIGYADTIEQAYQLISGLVQEMESRFKQMQRQGLKKSTKSDIYLIIDEYADLVLDKLNRAITEPLIQKLTTLGRASNIHVVACTQKVSAVVDTKIRCNFDSRLLLRVLSERDSKAVIEHIKDGYRLPRYGKGYYLSPAFTDVQLVDIPMVSDVETSNLIRHWKRLF